MSEVTYKSESCRTYKVYLECPMNTEHPIIVNGYNCICNDDNWSLAIYNKEKEVVAVFSRISYFTVSHP